MTQSVDIRRLNAELARIDGADARRATVQAADAVADVVRSTLGPAGLDKLLVGSGYAVATNDGARIIDRLEIDHPIAGVFASTAATQRSRMGDGATSAILVGAALLREADGLIEQGLHPTTVANGYALAFDHATAALATAAIEINTGDENALRNALETSVTGRWDSEAAGRFADLTVRAVRAVETGGEIDTDRLTLSSYPGGSLADSELRSGLVVDLDSSSTSLVSTDAELSRKFSDVGIALLDDQLTVQTADAVSHVEMRTPTDRAAFADHESGAYAAYVDALAAAGTDVVFCQKSIDDRARSLLTNAGIVPVERTRQDELHALARVTGARPIRSVDEIGSRTVGFAERVERRRLGSSDLLVIDAPGADHRSLLLRGDTEHVAEETERIARSCVRSLVALFDDPRVLAGGGAPEIELALAVREFADGVEGREQLAARAFADAVESVPRTLARNAGLDPIDALVDLRAAHANGSQHDGIDASSGELVNLVQRGVLDPLSVRHRALANATEAATLLVRVDDVIAAERTGESDHAGHDHEHDHGHGAVHDTGGYPWAIGH